MSRLGGCEPGAGEAGRDSVDADGMAVSGAAVETAGGTVTAMEVPDGETLRFFTVFAGADGVVLADDDEDAEAEDEEEEEELSEGDGEGAFRLIPAFTGGVGLVGSSSDSESEEDDDSESEDESGDIGYFPEVGATSLIRPLFTA